MSPRDAAALGGAADRCPTFARLDVAARGPLPVAVVNGGGGAGGRVGSRAALTPAVPRGGGLRMCLPAGRAAAGPVGVGALQAVPDRGGDGPGQGRPPPPGLLFASGGAAGRAPTAVFVAGCRAMSCHGCCPPRSLRSVSRPLRKRRCRCLGGTIRSFAACRGGALAPCSLPAGAPAGVLGRSRPGLTWSAGSWSGDGGEPPQRSAYRQHGR